MSLTLNGIEAVLVKSGLHILAKVHSLETVSQTSTDCRVYTIECIPQKKNLKLKFCIDKYGQLNYSFLNDDGSGLTAVSFTSDVSKFLSDILGFVASEREIPENNLTTMLRLLEHLGEVTESVDGLHDKTTIQSIMKLLKFLMAVVSGHTIKTGDQLGKKTDEYSLHSVISGVVPDDVKVVNGVLDFFKHTDSFKSDRYPYLFWNEYVRSASRVVSGISSSPESFTVGEIDDLFRSSSNSSPNGVSRFMIVVGVDAKLLPESKLANNAVLQVASQFNFLESKTTKYTAITEYSHDVTQGPQASIGSLAALILRDMRFKDRDPQTIFSDTADAYEGGYFMPYRLDGQQQSDFLNHLDKNINSLRVLAQWGLPELGSAPLLQVFNAAPSFQDDGNVIPTPLQTQICTKLVVSQYRATAQIAALRSLVAGTRVPLHLTLVGQGAFKNPGSVLHGALEAVFDAVNGFNVDVYIHCFNIKKDVLNLRTNLPGKLRHLLTKLDKNDAADIQDFLVPQSYWNKDEFMNGVKN